MSDYRRLISYIYSYEKGVKTRNSGFARVESRDGVCKINLSLRISEALMNEAEGNMLEVFMFTRRDGSVYKTNIGKIRITSGNSMFRGQYNTEEIGNAGLPLSDIVGIFICSRAFLDKNSTVNIVYASEWDDTTILVEEFAGLDEIEDEANIVSGKVGSEDIDISQNASYNISGENEVQNISAEQKSDISAAEISTASDAGREADRVNPTAQNGNAKIYEKQLQEMLKKSDNNYKQQADESVNRQNIAVSEQQTKENTGQRLTGNVGQQSGRSEGQRLTGNVEQQSGRSEGQRLTENNEQQLEENEGQRSAGNNEQQLGRNAGQRLTGNSEQQSERSEGRQLTENAEQRSERSAGQRTEENTEQQAERNTVEQDRQNNNISFNRPRTPGNADYFRMLCNCYPKIRVDELSGDCIKITPHDISYLPKKYWHLCNNSFLLHAFYNYRYILLCEEQDIKNSEAEQGASSNINEEKRYMICVPGMMHKREQAMAGMYGFTKFEGNEQGEVKNFGYWCMYL